MDRSGATRALRTIVTLLAAALPLVLVIAPDATARTWLPTALAGALTVTAALASLGALVTGLRRAALSPLLSAGASAALAGGGVAVVAGSPSLAVPLLAAAAFLIGSVLAGRVPPLAGRFTAITVAVIALLGAEAAALVEILPATAGLLSRQPILIGSVVLATVGAVIARGSAAGVLIVVGAAGLLVDRGGSPASVIGVAALVGSQLLVLREALQPTQEPPANHEARLPDLAAKLSEAVLRFDGRLALRDWNAAAAALLGLDGSSTGTRLEDLLGVSMAELPLHDGAVVSSRAIGGLEIGLHRAGAGVTAVIRDPGATPEAERLGNELRTTIEELLGARRTIDLQRGELERSATVDPLTGVASRGAILERLRLEVAQARRYRHPLAVVLLDIDRFGDVNREHGITGGDTVLREVALRIRLRVREADALGRAGSDGFIAALPHTDDAGAAIFADALRHRLALRPIAIGDELASVTVSIGVATMRPGEDLDLDGLLARVAEALDSARSTGGDRIALDRLHGLARLEGKTDAMPNRPPAPDEAARDR
ncbi:MAG: GGDEF domain-containing protein [Candidatus Limnocylindria bacterium]